MKADDFLPGEAVIAGIRADIDSYEAERRRVHRDRMWRVPMFDGLMLAAIFGLAWLFNSFADPNEQWVSPPHLILYVLGLAGMFFVHARAVRPARRLQASLRGRLMPVIFGFVEEMTYRHAEKPASFDRLPRETVGDFSRERFDDVITGRYDGFAFELYEAKLAGKSGQPAGDAFAGVIVAFETIAPFPGMLVATHKTGKATGFLRDLFGNRLREIRSGNAALDERYDFRTDNVEAALPLVTGRLAKALEWLHETWPENLSRVALKGRDGFLLIPQSKNFFELPGVSQPLDYKTHVAPMVADLAALLATAALVRKAGEAESGGGG